MKLIELKTTHPGGWKDILDTLGEKYPKVLTEKSEFLWRVVEQALGPKGMQLLAVPRLQRGGVDREEVPLAVTLSAIEHPVGGYLACLAYGMLLKSGFPVPGDCEWEQPAASWVRRTRDVYR